MFCAKTYSICQQSDINMKINWFSLCFIFRWLFLQHLSEFCGLFSHGKWNEWKECESDRLYVHVLVHVQVHPDKIVWFWLFHFLGYSLGLLNATFDTNVNDKTKCRRIAVNIILFSNLLKCFMMVAALFVLFLKTDFYLSSDTKLYVFRNLKWKMEIPNWESEISLPE